MITTSESHRLGLTMGLSHYAGAKSAALSYMRALAAEVGYDGITVNALSLGSMNNFDGHERAAQHPHRTRRNPSRCRRPRAISLLG